MVQLMLCRQVTCRLGLPSFNWKRSGALLFNRDLKFCYSNMTDISMNVLVYSGPGTSLDGVENTVLFLRKLIGGRFAVRTIMPDSLANEPWIPSTKLLVFPGGRDLPYIEHLKGRANDNIYSYVHSGGRFIGICAGSYFASGRCEFEVGTELEVVGERFLKFFPGICRGATFKGFDYDSKSGERAVTASFVSPPATCSVYYNGGGSFINAASYPNTTVLATYDEISDPEANAAAILCRVGDKGGLALLTALHLEYNISPMNPELYHRLNPSDKGIEEIFLHWLQLLGLDVAPNAQEIPEKTDFYLVFPDPESALWDMHPSFESIAKRLEAHKNPSSGCFEDMGQHFRIQPIPAGAVQHPTTNTDTPLSLRICPNPTQFVGASFNPCRFLELLEDAYAQGGLNARGFDAPVFGRVTIYSEVVGSSQSLWLENPKLVSVFPSGSTIVAARQVSGRGRGKNVWVSSIGCLQFSMYMEHPVLAGASVTLIQYLASLAMVEGVKRKSGYGELELYLKWPNDIYAIDYSADEPIKRKVGGVLVNSSFASQSFSMIIGIGINVTNSSPTICINDLVHQLNLKSGKPPLVFFTMEEVLARFHARFRNLYTQFLRDASGFSPFLDSYYSNWLHSQQLVTLTDQGNTPARVLGITPDYGLLEVVTVQAESGKIDPLSCQRFELQPDGNSFDMMTGFISKKV
ncbi:biotin holocarboxylase synthetase [Entomophthora muscae]|uniref:Biotin holocarboxylase synthetase n=1 Tax=Entomophthora muscae TaxID=34485 RepID=A0ACC2RI53_9FUNG|nr:biotin holocarboxylase synthetase [Entomophthora muscae]